MTDFFVQRIDDGRFLTPRPAYYGGVSTDDGWLMLVAAETHNTAALLAYQRWQKQRLGCVGFFDLSDTPIPMEPAWTIKVWDRGEASEIKIFQISHEVKTTYTAIEVKL